MRPGPGHVFIGHHRNKRRKGVSDENTGSQCPINTTEESAKDMDKSWSARVYYFRYDSRSAGRDSNFHEYDAGGLGKNTPQRPRRLRRQIAQILTYAFGALRRF